MNLNIWLEGLVSVLLLVALGLITVTVINRVHWPSAATIIQLAPVLNTKGGLILLLVMMWTFSLLLTVVFVFWVIVHKIDPQNSAVVLLLGMLTSGAFGGVSSVLWRTMTGEDTKPPTTSITEVKESKAPLP